MTEIRPPDVMAVKAKSKASDRLSKKSIVPMRMTVPDGFREPYHLSGIVVVRLFQ
jgi:hypothetical protein